MSMRKTFVFALAAGFVALLSAATQPVYAESAGCNASGCTTPGVNLNIEVIIPSMLRLRIGSAAAPDTITFDASAVTILGDGTPVAATAASGDLGNGRVSVRILSNDASLITVNATTTPLACVASSGTCQGGIDTIAWDQITVVQGTGASGFSCSKAPPQLVGGAGSQTYGSGLPGLIDEDCGWIYSYANTATPVGGTYSGVVTYTAAATP